MRALLLVLLAAVAAAVEVDAYVLGRSHHFLASDAGLSERNPGWGLGLSIPAATRVDVLAMAITYRDSFRERATAAGVGVRGILGDRDGFHATAALVVGKLRGSDYDGPVALPIVGAGYRWVNVEGTYAPDKHAAAAWLRVGVRL